MFSHVGVRAQQDLSTVSLTLVTWNELLKREFLAAS
jgi:hypothetical protein